MVHLDDFQGDFLGQAERQRIDGAFAGRVIDVTAGSALGVRRLTKN